MLNRIFPEGTFRKPTVLVILFSICFAFWFVDFWRSYNAAKNHNNFQWDVMNYYSYLPATFCNGGSYDFHQSGDSMFLPYGPRGGFVPKTTYGMSILYAPYFALGYKIAINQDSPRNGFSEPFATALRWGSIFYVIFGLMFLRKFLLRFFSEPVTAITLLAALFGTMLFFYTYVNSEMSHGYLFMLFSLFLYLVPKWHESPKLANTVLIGFTIGLISLIRPTEIYMFLFFIFWNVKSMSDFRLKLKLFASRYIHFVIMFLSGLLLWIPQFLFWKEHTGSYFYFSYPGERFFWNDPQLMNILFSYRKGWITYTPLVLMSFAGFFFVKKDFPLSKWLFIFVTAMMIYVLSCWWDWVFGGSFGARAFCQNIAWLAIPFAFFVDFVFYSSRKFFAREIVRLVTVLFIFSCICLNIGQTYQYKHNLIHYDGMTKRIYWDVFRKYQYDDIYQFLYWGYLESPDYEKMRRGERDL